MKFPSRLTPGTEVGPGILYVDLCDTPAEDIEPVMNELADSLLKNSAERRARARSG